MDFYAFMSKLVFLPIGISVSIFSSSDFMIKAKLCRQHCPNTLWHFLKCVAISTSYTPFHHKV